MHFIENTEYEILTPSGFQDFDGLRIVEKKFVLFITSQGSIKATSDHKFICQGREVLAKDLVPGDSIDPGAIIFHIEETEEIGKAYDPINVANGHLYIGGGVVNHNCSFLGSAGTLIIGDKLQKLAFVDPIWVSETEDFKIYEKPDPTHKYILTADVSEGVDRDYSVISIFDVTERPFKHVAKYRNNQIPPEMFVDVIAKLGKKYNEALAIIETNSIGVNVAKDLWLEYEYENIVRSVERESGAKVSYGGQSKLGVKTTKATKRIGCSTLKSLIETDTLITNDFEAISELSTFISQNSSWGAEEGKYDDVVMSMVLFAWFTQQQAFEDYMSGAMNSVLRKARQDQEWGMPDIQFTDGIEDDGFDNTMFAPPVSRGSGSDAEILYELF